ncbi:MAG: hypothetical protein AABZ34_18945 [Nitrospirota bacterium]
MRIPSRALVILGILLTVSPALAKDNQSKSPMDPQAMMEIWKQAATPGEPHK